MVKVTPVKKFHGDTEDTFDDLRKLAFGEENDDNGFNNSLFTSNKVAVSGISDDGRIKPKRTYQIDQIRTKEISKYQQCKILLFNFLFGKQSRRLGMPFITSAVLLLGILEIWDGFKSSYNFPLLLALEASIVFTRLPQNSVRPQLCLSAITFLSFAIDIFNLLSIYRYSVAKIIIFSFALLSKVLVFYTFLINISQAKRLRKYLDRRLRLFFIPLHQPKRIMRDVRGRFLALGWLELSAVACYLSFFFFYYFYFDYGQLYLSTSLQNSLSLLLLMKTGSSMLVLLGLLYDTDIRLCLWYFGCLGFCVNYVRKYIKQQQRKLKGFPLVFSYYSTRFNILSFVKTIDVAIGLYTLILILYSFGSGVEKIERDLQIFLSFLLYLIICTDFYYTTLFLGIRWLLRRQKLLKKLNYLDKSDDSEIEEFRLQSKDGEEEQVRNPLLLTRTEPLEETMEDLDKVAYLRDAAYVQFKIRVKGQNPKGFNRSKHAIMPHSDKYLDNDGRIWVDNQRIDVLDQPSEKLNVRRSKPNLNDTLSPIHQV